MKDFVKIMAIFTGSLLLIFAIFDVRGSVDRCADDGGMFLVKPPICVYPDGGEHDDRG